MLILLFIDGDVPIECTYQSFMHYLMLLLGAEKNRC